MIPVEKESYSIDDILSEVKKRREENELELREKGSPDIAAKQARSDGDDEEFVLEESEPLQADGDAQSVRIIAESVQSDEPDGSADFSINTKNDNAFSEPEEDDAAFTVRETGGSKAEQPSSSVDTAEPEQADDTGDTDDTVEADEADNTDDNDEADNTGEAFSAEAQDAQSTDAPAETSAKPDVQADVQPDSDGMVDLLSLASKQEEQENQPQTPQEKQKFSKTKKGKITISVIVILIVLIIAAAVFAVLYANNILGKITNNSEEEPYEMVTYYDGMDFLQEEFPTIDELSASEIYSYKEYLKQWYLNGDPVNSTHVLNVLLIGEDTREEEISDASRADSAIIVSINIDTGEITMTSVLRDLYVYYEVDGVGQYGKINESASLGGMKTYINTLERYYKISINNYAVVNFASFPKIIDALGGVSIKMTSAEIYEINNHPKRYGGVTITQTFDGSEGTMKLNGEQALAYCRIRKIDSDGARADRQKTVLNALFKKIKSSGTVDIVKTVNQLSGYVYTGYDKKELIEIGNTALKDGWLGYETSTCNVPSTENCKGGQGFSAAPGTWIWLADIPKDAYELQMKIYGKSNINLNENRPDYIAMGR